MQQNQPPYSADGPRPPPYSESVHYPPLPDDNKFHQPPPQQPPYPAGGFPQQQQQFGPTTITTTQVIISRPKFGPYPVEFDCPYCQSHVVTSTRQVPGALAWTIAIICIVLGFFLIIPWLLCWIPFCIDGCLDVEHNCPSCRRQLGRFSRM